MRLCSRPNERYTTLFSSSSLTGTESCTMFPILCRHAFVGLGLLLRLDQHGDLRLAAATCLMASSASSPARFSAETALFALLNSELAVGLPPRVAPLGIQRDDVIHVLHALAAACDSRTAPAFRENDRVRDGKRRVGWARAIAAKTERRASRETSIACGRHFAIARRWRARRTGRRRGERTGSPPFSARNRLMSSIAAECEPRLCARCVEQCWAVSGDSDVYPCRRARTPPAKLITPARSDSGEVECAKKNINVSGYVGCD